MANIIDIKSKSQFFTLIETHPYVAVQAHATWCGPCKAISPFFARHASEIHASDPAIPDTYAFAKFDTDEVPDLAMELGIRSIRAFFFFEDGDKSSSITGPNPGALKKSVFELGDKAKAKVASSGASASADDKPAADGNAFSTTEDF